MKMPHSCNLKTKNPLKRILLLLAACISALPSGAANPRAERPDGIVISEGASWAEKFAGREVRRYWYLRTGRLLPMIAADNALPKDSGLIVVARRDRPLVRGVAKDVGLQSTLDALGPEQYVLKTISSGNTQAALLVGADDSATLYAAYSFAEQLGVRFYMHGDVIPDVQENLRMPVMHKQSKPLFALRGIQPFHDFPEGPDWWNLDDYRAVLSQLPKMRMNFFGLHTYPEARPNAEPTVWIGLPEDIGERSKVKFSYPSSYQNTLRGNWGYQAKKTMEYAWGTGNLFELDGYGPEVMLGFCPQPSTPEACNQVFESAGALLHKAFAHARRLEIKTCVGTETPLAIPKFVAERLKNAGKDPKDPAVVQELYEGIFKRAANTYDLDYYWFWTPEDWTWSGVKPELISKTTNDFAAAIAAWKKVNPPFKLATCGWVLGPQTDRALFDKTLPKNMAVSCINREVGRTPVDPAFAQVEGRGKWAIPWLEDDPALASPQLWVGRMRRDAADAYRYGCDGLMGIHWRTRVLGPAVSALAKAGWEQGDWNKPSPLVALPKVAGPVGGQIAGFSQPIADTEEDPLYQTVRYNVSAYHLPFSNGLCTVTLKFCEPHYTNAGQRVFDVKLQGKTVLENLDIFARVGKDRALDFTYENVEPNNRWIDIEFVHRTEYPSIAAIWIRDTSHSTKINCGGPAYAEYAADMPAAPLPKPAFPPTSDFYKDWATAEFGPEIGTEAAEVFAKIDGDLPRACDWVEGPGGIRPDKRPWEKVEGEYWFVAKFAGLGGKVKGTGNRARFDYWLHTFQYMRSMGQVNCAWADYNETIKKVKAEQKADVQKELARKEALPARIKLVTLVNDLYQHLLATLSNPGELGTLMNWEQHNLPGLLTKPGRELAVILGEDLPPEANLSAVYRGPTRLIVPTVRTSYTPGEDLKLRLLVLSETQPKETAVYWRKMGRGRFAKASATNLARSVYSVQLPGEATAGEDLEYYVKLVPEKGKPVFFPATAPQLNQTLVMQ